MEEKWESFQERTSIFCRDCLISVDFNQRSDARKWARVHFDHTGHRSFDITVREAYYRSEVIK